jgi:glycosyltransferase involved in cell wall biosynthesis
VNLLVDGYWWTEGPMSNRMVLHEIVRRWVRDYPNDRITLAVPSHHKATVPDGVELARTRLRVHPAINFLELPLIGRRRRADAILAFNFAANSATGAVFLHDVLFQSNPEWFTPVERVYFSAMPLLAPRAGSVVTTSQSELDRIRRFNPKLRRVVTSGLAVPSSLSTVTATDPGLHLEPGRYLLCVGRLNVRKNLLTTLRAALRSGVLSKDFPLVVVGEPSGRITLLDHDFRSAVAAGTILIVDRISESRLKWLYSHCALFMCMSLDEGFGLPPVEAATLGCRVLASDIPVFRETLGRHATFVDAADPDAIVDAIRGIAGQKPSAHHPGYRQAHTWSSVCRVIRDELLSLSGSSVLDRDGGLATAAPRAIAHRLSRQSQE